MEKLLVKAERRFSEGLVKEEMEEKGRKSEGKVMETLLVKV